MKKIKITERNTLYLVLCVVFIFLVITIRSNNSLKMSNSRLHQIKDMQFELIYKMDEKLDSCNVIRVW